MTNRRKFFNVLLGAPATLVAAKNEEKNKKEEPNFSQEILAAHVKGLCDAEIKFEKRIHALEVKKKSTR